MFDLEEVEQVREFIRQNISVTTSLQSSSLDSAKTRRKLQHFSCLKMSDKKKQSIYDFFLSYAFKSEKDCPGSGLLFLKKVSNTYKPSFDESACRNKQSLLKAIELLGHDNIVTALLKQTIDMSSISTKVSVKKTSSKETYIELVEGHCFDVSSLLNSSALVDKSHTVCIDGYIETVSEIHHLLEFLSEKKSVCIIFCRGMSKDVLHTLKVNNDRGTLTVYPYVVPFDVENANTLVDVAVVTNTDVVSSLKGSLISSINSTDLGYIEKCTLTKSGVKFKSLHPQRTKNHIKNILQKLEERPELEHHLSRRIRSLSSNSIEICIPDDINYYAVSQQLDEGIRVISSIIHNMYDPDRTSQFYFDRCNSTLDSLFVV